MVRELGISELNLKSLPCDLCGSTDTEFILDSHRLDGPLVRCTRCRLYFVITPERDRPQGLNGKSGEVAAEMVRLSERARDLALVDPSVEENERPWRELMAEERLGDLKRFIDRGRLLEIGSSTGEMLAAARTSFEVCGVEADARSSEIARGRGLDSFNGALEDAHFPDNHFDCIALYHVIEHFASPASEIREMHRILKPEGWLVVETPNIDTIWFRLLGARWRQFIPDHIFFYDPRTITALCEKTGFRVRELRNVGKAMSVRLFINRIGRYHRAGGKALNTISDRLNLGNLTIHVNMGDVMRIYTKKVDG